MVKQRLSTKYFNCFETLIQHGKKEQISHILVSTAVGILSNFLYLTTCMSSTVVLLVKTDFTACCTRITLHLTKTLESLTIKRGFDGEFSDGSDGQDKRLML